jgi:hypothetical protein
VPIPVKRPVATPEVPYFDESFQPITDDATAYKAGYRVLSSYGGTNSPKTLTRARAEAWFAQGPDTGIAALFEATAARALSAGRSGGAADAKASRAYWRSLGMPDSCMITWAMDTNVSSSDLPALREYATGWKSDTCLSWAYIEPDVGEALYADGLIGGIFATAAYSWDPDGKAGYDRPHVFWRQEHNGVNAYGGNIDIGHIQTSAPIWWRTSMPVTQADSDLLWVQTKTYDGESMKGAVQDGRNFARAARDQAVANAASLAGIVKTEAAIQLALSSGSTSGDAAALAALAAQIKALGDQESAAVATLAAQVAAANQRIVDLEHALANALTAEAAALSAK